MRAVACESEKKEGKGFVDSTTVGKAPTTSEFSLI